MGDVARARPVEAASKPVEKGIYHDVATVSSTPTIVTDRKCSTIQLWPDSGNAGVVYFGAEESDSGEALSADNGFPLFGTVGFAANQSNHRVQVWIVGTPGDKVRWVAVL